MSEYSGPVGLRQLLYPVADRLEAWLGRRPVDRSVRPLIVLGPPRSGTTLFYQAFTDSYRVSWFSNLADKKARWPCLATRVVHRKIVDYQSDYSSRYGQTEGIAGPAEARRLWSKWFTYDYADESIPEEQIDDCRRVVGYVSTLTGLPFVSKNPDHCIRCRALNVVFPDAIYIRIRRDPIDVARSILNARKNHLGSYDKWFGVRPPEISQESTLTATDSALLQVGYLEKRLDEDFASVLRPDHQITIEYDRLCAAPAEECRRVSRLAKACGIDLEKKRSTEEVFRKSSGKPLPDEMEGALRSSIEAGILDDL